jgi:3-oxoadipate enol-lactonase
MSESRVSTVQRISGPDIAYRRTGSGPPLVLLHPLALSGAVWGEFATRLSETFDVIAPDARGHGDSGWDGAAFGVDDLADDVAALLDGLGLSSARLVGLSMGGSTALSFAGRYPQRADGLVLADTTAWYGPEAMATWAERAADVVARPRPRQVPFQVERWFTEGFRNRHAEEVNRVVGLFLRTSSLAHAHACRALGAMDGRALLPAVTTPALVVTGAQDYATPPAMGQAIADGVPAGEARVLPGLRHLSLVEQPSLADTAAAFLTADAPRGARGAGAT